MISKAVLGRYAAFYALCAFWVTLTFSPALANISLVTALLGWGLWRFHERQSLSTIFPPTVMLPAFVFLGLVIVSAIFSEYLPPSLRGLEKTGKQIAILVIVYDVFRDASFLKMFEKIALALAWVILIDALSQYIFGRDFIRGKVPEDSGAGVRLGASFGAYGKFAAFLVLTIPYIAALAYYFLKKNKDRSRGILSLLVTVGLLGALFLTRSRGAILAFSGALVFILLLRKKFLILGAFLIIGAVAVSLLPRNMVIHLDAERKEQSVVERLYLWDRALNVIKAKPLTGTGINTYAVAHQKYDTRKNWRVRDYYAHNGYLHLGAETGLPCLGAFLWLLGACFYQGLKSMRADVPEFYLRMGLLMGLAAFLLFSAVDTVMQSPQPIMTFWFLMGVMLAYALPDLKRVSIS